MSSSDIGYHDSSGGSPAAPQQENSQNKGNELFVYFRVVYFTKLIFFPSFSVPISKFFPPIYKTIYLGFIYKRIDNLNSVFAIFYYISSNSH